MLVLVLPFGAFAGDYPDRDLTLIVQASPGGASDFITRTYVPHVEKILGRRINIIYKPGASGSIGMGALADSKPDGYTIGVLPGEVSTLKLLGFPDITTDRFDFIAMVLRVPTSLAVKSDSPFKNVADLVAAAKKAPGKITVGIPGYGAAFHLAVQAFEKSAGVTFKYIPLDSCAPVLVAVLGGHVDVGSCGPGESKPYLTAKTMRSLGIMSDARMPQFSDIPTVKEQGVDVAVGSWAGFGTPKGVPPEILTKLRDAFLEASQNPQVIAAFNERGFIKDFVAGEDYRNFANQQTEFFSALMANFKKP